MKAVAWLGLPMTETAHVPLWWIDKALTYMSAEAEAQESINNRHK